MPHLVLIKAGPKKMHHTYKLGIIYLMIMVSAVKWVDEVIPDAPYAITEDFMRKLFDEYNIDYIIHGDDPCVLPDGTDAYALAKKAGRYKQIKRIEGVSSTDIVAIFVNYALSDFVGVGACEGNIVVLVCEFLVLYI
ncbi:hypothetical protein ACS0TY_012903 [Phlomoides rotata]